jgi:hypothetical protein
MPSGIQIYNLLTRGDVEDWLSEKHTEEIRRITEDAQMQGITLRWAKIAGWAGIVSVIVGVASIVVPLLLAQ